MSFLHPRAPRKSPVLLFIAFSAAGSLGALLPSGCLAAGYYNVATIWRDYKPFAFVQGGWSAPQSPQTSVSVAYPSAQQAGDTNVIAIGWNSGTTTVTGVTDTSGNTYSVASAATQDTTDGVSEQFYYAPSIHAATAGANTVTVGFSASTPYPDVRILEYQGLQATSPLDVEAGAWASNATTSTSGSATTSWPSDLLVGASVVNSGTEAAGAGATARILTSPNSDLVEDQIVTAPGSYSLSAMMASGAYAMQMAAFKLARPYMNPSGGKISFVQSNTAGSGSSSVTSEGASFSSSQTAGDLDVALVSWNSTSGTVSVSDTANGSYATAVPLAQYGSGSLAIFYHSNIAAASAGSNTVTATISAAATDLDITVLEYKGLSATSPLDQAASASGDSLIGNSGSVATAYGPELIIGASEGSLGPNLINTGQSSRALSPDITMDASDSVVAGKGSYSTASMAAISTYWIQEIATFH